MGRLWLLPMTSKYMRIHTIESPYDCIKCGKAFIAPSKPTLMWENIWTPRKLTVVCLFKYLWENTNVKSYECLLHVRALQPLPWVYTWKKKKPSIEKHYGIRSLGIPTYVPNLLIHCEGACWKKILWLEEWRVASSSSSSFIAYIRTHREALEVSQW